MDQEQTNCFDVKEEFLAGRTTQKKRNIQSKEQLEQKTSL